MNESAQKSRKYSRRIKFNGSKNGKIWFRRLKKCFVGAKVDCNNR